EALVAIEDAGLVRDALGVVTPGGVPDAFLEPVPDAVEVLLARYARTHGPFTTAEVAIRFELEPGRVEAALGRLELAERLVRGELRPGGAEREWCDPDVLRRIRRATLAVLRREVEPAEQRALGRFLPAWHGIGGRATGHDRLLEVIGQLEGYPLPASILERDVLPARVRDYTPRLLDELGAAGEVVWIGRGALGAGDGRVALYLRDRAELLASAGAFEPSERPDGPLHDA
ncbi:MAG TPA: DEAD/DEAH box helicase, partial [Candidatus Limnocylindria bacterium]|nr:DEAD/DEAH box helicase [Candidatus Limnocylindria bacterium]